MNTKDNPNPSWVVYREYKDTQGNIHTEYKDREGNTHFYTNGSVDAQLTREYEQDLPSERADKNTSKGLLIGVIVTCVAGLTAGTIYFLTKMNNPPPVPVSVIQTREKVTPAPTPPVSKVTIVEKPTVTIVPIPQTQTQTQTPDSTVNVTANPSVSNPSPQPGATNTVNVKPAEKPDSSVSNPVVVITPKETANPPTQASTKTDGELKTEILNQLKSNIANHQLVVDVKNGEVLVSGIVRTPEQLQQIQPLLKSIQGIKRVDVTATVASKVSDAIKDAKNEVKKVID